MKNNYSINRTAPKSSIIQRFFWWCAGANSEILEQCRDDWRKFTSIGIFVCLVALLATVSGTFFLTETFGISTYFAALGGMFWGAIIFSVDRVMLVFYQKGSGEWKRILPRLFLSLLISIVINEPLFVRSMSGEINRKIYAEKDLVLNETRTKSDKQNKKAELRRELDEFNQRLKSLEQIKDDAEKEMNKERAGILSGTTTGKTGEGSIFSIKKKIFEEARNNFETEKIVLDEKIALKKQELQKIEDEISGEVVKKDEAESSANGFWKKHEIMFSLMADNPIMILVYLIFSLVLLGLENTPLLQKFMADKSEYDTVVEKKKELADERVNNWFELEKQKIIHQHTASAAVNSRVVSAVESGDLNLSNAQENELAKLTHLEIIRRETGELYAQRAAQSAAADLGKPITLEAVGFPQLSAQMSIPSSMEDSLTLDDLSGEVNTFAVEVSKDCGKRVELVQATNTSGEDIDRNFLPLVPQLDEDRKLLLYFDEAIQTAGSATS